MLLKEGAVRLVESYDSELDIVVSQTAEKLRDISERANEIVVEDSNTFTLAVSTIESIEAMVAVVTDIVEPFRQRAYDYYKGVLAEKKSLLEAPEAAVARLRDEVSRYRGRLEKAVTDDPRASDVKRAVVVADSAGISYREYWKAECTDIVALCKAIVDGKAPPELVTFNQTEGNKLARSLRDMLSNIPGLRSQKETRMVRK